MTYAIKQGNQWVELPDGKPIKKDSALTAYGEMLKWSPQYRTAQGIKVVQEAPVPEGKYVTSKSIQNIDDKPVYVYQYGDVNPTSLVPQEVTMRQARAILIEYGLDEQVDTLIGSMPNKEGKLARNDWEYAATIKRDHPLILYMIAQLGLSEAQADQMFTEASQLS